jgi:hypothetical protein
MGASCTGTTQRGERCKASPLRGTDRCHHHGEGSSGRRGEWDRDAFLAAFEETGMVSHACRLVGVGRSTVYVERQRNEDFAVAWADVEERVVESMEGEAYRRAVKGVEKPLVSAGRLVTTVNEYSDGLLMFLLKARRPEVYRENVKVEHSGATSLNIVPVSRDHGADVVRILRGTGAAGERRTDLEQQLRADLVDVDDEDLAALERILGKLGHQ